MADMNDPLQALLAKQAITEVIVRYSRALDRLDETLLRSVFHPDSVHHHFYQGPSSAPDAPRPADGGPRDFVEFALGVLSTHTRTHHQLGNTLIELTSADHAVAETYFTAYHRMRPRGDPKAAPNACDTEMDYFVGGRYLDHFACRDGEWRITRRTGMTDWTRLEPPNSQGFHDIAAETIGQHYPDDLLYHWAGKD
ncbi:nuclear transport factor 2 family protein [Haliea sp. E1-2-M8]|uniref:nuclear transport factor 2 family protein n=1 Tax=Haliea sp. E1-2-M8 TaxID=3064706 RepID=UPI002721B931|nr:nuclear transport factor 2 family protein [Haliea sp. E1-2-M8]MDO8860446.1 nuclear transport factor 2 family protein [Haliea sp. E1-2-M8]